MCISVSTIDLLGPGQHWQNQQVLKSPLEKIESESQTNQIVSMGKNSSGSARISVPPPPALHRRGDHHPAYHWPHVVQLAIQHDVSNNG